MNNKVLTKEQVAISYVVAIIFGFLFYTLIKVTLGGIKEEIPVAIGFGICVQLLTTRLIRGRPPVSGRDTSKRKIMPDHQRLYAFVIKRTMLWISTFLISIFSYMAILGIYTGNANHALRSLLLVAVISFCVWLRTRY